MIEYRPGVPDALQRIFADDYLHRMKRDEGGFVINSKKATLLKCDDTNSTVFLTN
jgi:hypothetical protein